MVWSGLKLVIVAALFSLFSTLSFAQAVIESPEADETSLTIYPKNIAMVREVRKVNLPAGKSTIRFFGVSDKMVSQTALLQSFDGLRLESNFDSDLMSKGSILNQSIGQTILIQRVNPLTGEMASENVKLLAAPQTGITVQGLVFETAKGVETLYCSGLAETIIMNNLPDGVNSVPVLSMDVLVDAPGEKEIALSYMTRGVNWAADYRFDADEDKKQGNLLGWLTIRNNTSKSFKDAPTAVIAGEINLDGKTRPDDVYALNFSPKCWEKGSTKTGTPVDLSVHKFSFTSVGGYWDDEDEIIVTGSRIKRDAFMSYALETASEEDFSDYKLYRTARPVTVAAQQKKQVAFIYQDGVEFKNSYRFNFRTGGLVRKRQQPENADVYVEIDNSKDGNLNKALPKGVVRVMNHRDNGHTFFRGEAEIPDLAIGLPVELNIGKSPLVQMLPDMRFVADEVGLRFEILAVLSNAADEAVETQIHFPIYGIQFSDFSAVSHSEKTGHVYPAFSVVIPPNGFERFVAEIPLLNWVTINHGYGRYKRKNGELTYDFKATNAVIAFADSGQEYDWLNSWMKSDSEAIVTMLAKVISEKKIDSGRNEYEEGFQFTNEAEEQVRVLFEFPRNGRHKILSSSLEQRVVAYSQWPQWVISLDAGETKTLTVKSQMSRPE